MPEKKSSRQNTLVSSYTSGSQFTQFCFSHDSRYLFCCCGSVIKVFNLKNGELLQDLVGHRAAVTGVSVNPTNVLQIYSCCEDGYLMSWDYLDGAKLKEHFLHMPLYGIVSINDKTGSVMMIARTSQTATQYGLLQWTRKTDTPSEFASPQVLIPNCNKDQGLVSFGCMNSFAASAQNTELSVYSMKTGRIRVLTDSDTYNKDKRITCVACQPNEHCIAVGLENGRILFWHDFFDGGESKYSMAHWHNVAVLSLNFSPDGSILLSGGHECVFVRWQMYHNYQKDFKPRMGAPLTGVLCSPNGNYFATRHLNNVIQVMDVNLCVLHVYRGISHPNWNIGPEENPIPVGLLYDPRSRCIVTNGLPGHLQFYSLSLQKQLYNLDIVGQNYISPENLDRPAVVTHVKKASVSQDGQWLASFEMWDDGAFTPELKLKFWLYSSQEKTYVLNTVVESPHESEVNSMCFRPPPQSSNMNPSPVLITTGKDRCFKLWALIDDTDIYRANTRWNCDSIGFYRDMETQCADFSSDGSSLAVAFDHMVTLWDPESNIVRTSLTNKTADKQIIKSLKFGSLESRFLLVTVSDHLLTSYNLLSLTVEWSLNLDSPSLLVRDPASDLMATVSQRGALNVFKPKSPKVIYSKDKVTPEPVFDVAFIPNSRPDDVVDMGWPGTSQLYFYTQKYSLVTLDRPDRAKQLDKVKIHQNLPKSSLSALMAEKVVKQKEDGDVKDTQRKSRIAEDDFVSTMLHTNEPISAFCDQFIDRLLIKKKHKKSKIEVKEEYDQEESETEDMNQDDSDSGEKFPLTETFFDPALSDFLKEESQASEENETKLDSLLSKKLDWVKWCGSLSLK